MMLPQVLPKRLMVLRTTSSPTRSKRGPDHLSRGALKGARKGNPLALEMPFSSLDTPPVVEWVTFARFKTSVPALVPEPPSARSSRPAAVSLFRAFAADFLERAAASARVRTPLVTATPFGWDPPLPRG